MQPVRSVLLLGVCLPPSYAPSFIQFVACIESLFSTINIWVLVFTEAPYIFFFYTFVLILVFLVITLKYEGVLGEVISVYSDYIWRKVHFVYLQFVC